MAETTRREITANLRLSQKYLSALLSLTADVQNWQPEPAEWSFRLIAAHLVTIERDCYIPRVTRIASGENPYFYRYVNTGVDLDCGDLQESLDQWAMERSRLLDFVAVLSDDALRRTGVHEIYGTINTVDSLSELAEHDLRVFRHVEQLIEDYLEEVDEGVSDV